MANRTSATNPDTREVEDTTPNPLKTKAKKHLMWGMRTWQALYTDVLARPDVAGDTAKADAYMRGLATAIRTLDRSDLEP